MSAEAIARILGEALRLIGEVVSSVKEKRQIGGIGAAADALTVIGAIVESVKHGDLTKIDPIEVSEEMARLRRALEHNDAAADAALAEKFDKE